MNSRISAGSIWLIFASAFLIVSCTSSSYKREATTYAVQPGEKLNTYLLANNAQPDNINDLLLKYDGSKKAKRHIKLYRNEIAELFTKKVLDITPSTNSDEIKSRLQSITTEESTALFSLYPIDTAKWMKLISIHSELAENEVYESAIAAGLDPSIVFKASAAGFEDTVTPLINSIGIVIYGQDETSTATVRFRADDEMRWQKGLNLSWEPVYGSFAGSIVYLNADTTYHIEVQITDPNGEQQEHVFQTKTKPNSPPIDPEKVYYLSDIYSGGKLDLEALNINGSADGYAKIIGDGQVIEASSDDLAAVNIGAQSYVMLENLTIKGGQRYGIFAKKAHHIWIKGCNVSEFGREAVDIRDGLAYASPTTNSPINYDSGIYLERSGIAVIEECEVHSPNLGANSWQVGHPKGANALQVWAYHDSDAYRGEFIVRNNRFYGAPNHRFNDVIEGRKNFERRGGFVRNSAIYNNYLAYANDDLIEIDGGQQNVLVYGNEMEQGYAGISIAPNMLGPSYIFHNHIHNLGDETGKEWTAIKAGGLISKPAGRTFIFENVLDVDRNGIAASKVNNDTTFWITSQNNIIFTKNTGYAVGYCIFDKEKYIGSTSTNDLCFNENTIDSRYEFNTNNLTEHAESDNIAYITSLKENASPSLTISEEFIIPNFSSPFILQAAVKAAPKEWYLNASETDFTNFPKQYRYGDTILVKANTVMLTGNNWQVLPLKYTLTKNSVLKLNLSVEGKPEVVGVGFETDTQLNSSRIVKFHGTQAWGIRGEDYFNGESGSISFPIGKYITGKVNYLVLALDNDNIESWRNRDKVTFEDIRLVEASLNEK
ncbi:right-handed parallel beta-helix repeat-containing protein [Alteromonas macleodii]|uniref:right-handed parallel beta-helix repeat-containing protein n=1 Tax=Alteromonas macleodii TaxID=28108 RepID=UPI002076A1E5|nr:right-handed parallel beta-helix repeat-containing protein [Alteromonas macleodii]USI26326.1 right-handed parallel beta-helix repeat-containing protein [Alteromonas macleodii]